MTWGKTVNPAACRVDSQILMMIPYRKNLAHKLNRRGETMTTPHNADRADFSTATLFCELCEDERLAEDINEDGRCPTCEEREEKNENGI